jgi:hypothetical protein
MLAGTALHRKHSLAAPSPSLLSSFPFFGLQLTVDAASVLTILHLPRSIGGARAGWRSETSSAHWAGYGVPRRKRIIN